MLWIITNVNPRAGFSAAESKHYVGKGSPGSRLVAARRGLPAEAVPAFVQGWATTASEFTHEFRLLDADGIIHFEGVCEDLGKFDASQAFWPQDYGAAETDCTHTEYRLKGSKSDWEAL